MNYIQQDLVEVSIEIKNRKRTNRKSKTNQIKHSIELIKN